MNEKIFSESFAAVPFMAILRGFDQKQTIQLCERAWDVGIRLVEVPIQSPAAVRTLASAVQAGTARGAAVGAGTVTTVERVRQAADSGAAFTVAPGFSRTVAEASLSAGLPHLAGVSTASEIQQAQELGLTWLKAFPASTMGATWIPAMHGPFPDMRFVATGGMNLANAEAYLDAGASAVSLGSALADDSQFGLLHAVLDKLRHKATR